MMIGRKKRQDFSIYLVGAGESVGNDTLKFLADVVAKEISEIEYRSVVFAREPSFALAHLGASKVARVTAGSLAPYAVVLPQAVFEEGLG